MHLPMSNDVVIGQTRVREIHQQSAISQQSEAKAKSNDPDDQGESNSFWPQTALVTHRNFNG